MKNQKIMLRRADQYKNMVWSSLIAFASILAIAGTVLLLIK